MCKPNFGLKLSAEQKKRVQTAVEEYDQRYAEERMKAPRTNFAALTELRRKLGKEATDKVLAVLTAQQRRTWEELIGELFDLKLTPRRGAN